MPYYFTGMPYKGAQIFLFPVHTEKSLILPPIRIRGDFKDHLAGRVRFLGRLCDAQIIRIRQKPLNVYRVARFPGKKRADRLGNMGLLLRPPGRGGKRNFLLSGRTPHQKAVAADTGISRVPAQAFHTACLPGHFPQNTGILHVRRDSGGIQKFLFLAHPTTPFEERASAPPCESSS